MLFKRKLLMLISTILFLSLIVSGGFIIRYLTGPSTPIDPVRRILSSDPVNVLIMVGDKEDYNTDTIMLANYNPKTGSISFLSIPRDTRVIVDGYARKINSVFSHHQGGPQAVTNVVSNLLNININYYVHIKISIFKKVIDMLGGVDYKVPVNLNYDDPSQGLHIHLKRGFQHLDGDKAEQLLRFRHPQHSWTYHSKIFIQYYDGSDTKRTERQLDFMKALIRQKANIGYLGQFNEVIKTVFKETDTNIKMNEALMLILSIDKINFKNTRTFRISGESQTINGASYFIYNGKLYDPKVKKAFDRTEMAAKYFKAIGPFINKELPSDVIENNNDSDSTDSGSTDKSPVKTAAPKPSPTVKPQPTKTAKPKPSPTVAPTATPTVIPTPAPTETPTSAG